MKEKLSQSINGSSSLCCLRHIQASVNDERLLYLSITIYTIGHTLSRKKERVSSVLYLAIMERTRRRRDKWKTGARKHVEFSRNTHMADKNKVECAFPLRWDEAFVKIENFADQLSHHVWEKKTKKEIFARKKIIKF
jgi:hypothetical protein